MYESSRYRVFQQGDRIFLQSTSDALAELSLMDRNDATALRDYAIVMLQPLAFIEAPRTAILIGLGGGQQATFIHRHLPQLHLTALEIDAEVVDIARRHFQLPEDNARLQVVVGDGVAFIEQLEQMCDLILSEAYGEGNCIVEALHTEAFYRRCHGVLSADGVMAVNIFRPDQSWGVGYLAMLQRVFAEVYWATIAHDQYVLILCKDHVSRRWPAIIRQAARLDARAPLHCAALVARLSAPGL